MSEAPSMDDIRGWFAEEYRCCTGNSLVEAGQAFDAALAAHDNDLRQDIAEQIAAELHKFGVIADASGACDKAEIWWNAEAIARMDISLVRSIRRATERAWAAVFGTAATEDGQ